MLSSRTVTRCCDSGCRIALRSCGVASASDVRWCAITCTTCHPNDECTSMIDPTLAAKTGPAKPGSRRDRPTDPRSPPLLREQRERLRVLLRALEDLVCLRLGRHEDVRGMHLVELVDVLLVRRLQIC